MSLSAINWSEVEEAREFPRVTPGGYICKITMTQNFAEKEYLKLEYDIAEGELKGYYADLYASKGFWGGSFIKSYKEKARPFFKGMLTAIEMSNRGFKFDGDEKKLVGKLVGLVLCEEEYRGNDGTIKTRLYVESVRSVDAIRKGEFEIKPLKKLAGSQATNTSGFEELIGDEESLPF